MFDCVCLKETLIANKKCDDKLWSHMTAYIEYDKRIFIFS